MNQSNLMLMFYFDKERWFEKPIYMLPEDTDVLLCAKALLFRFLFQIWRRVYMTTVYLSSKTYYLSLHTLPCFNTLPLH